MATKLDTFLNNNKITHRQLLSASRQIERLRPEDRAIKLIQKQVRKKEDGKKPDDLAKPRSGRTITTVGLAKALAGKQLSGPQRTRFVRAVNRILEQKKKKPIDMAALFEPPAPKEAASADEAASE